MAVPSGGAAGRLMVDRLSAGGWLRAGSVKDAMLAIDRELFFPKGAAHLAYEDIAYPVGYGQTISAPAVVAFMLEQLFLERGMRVLEVGTGTGYNTALLSHIVGEKGSIISFEVVPELTALAEKNLKARPLPANTELHTGDASCGFEPGAPYDRIIATAAMPCLDAGHPMARQLKPDGRIVAPVGSRFGQDLMVFDRKTGSCKSVLPVVFVPMIGKCGFR